MKRTDYTFVERLFGLDNPWDAQIRPSGEQFKFKSNNIIKKIIIKMSNNYKTDCAYSMDFADGTTPLVCRVSKPTYVRYGDKLSVNVTKPKATKRVIKIVF